MSAKTETTVLDLTTLNPNQLKELQGWEEKQLEVVKENPFVEISDHKTYEEGKKARTNLRTARTTLEKQDKDIASALSQFRKSVGEATGKLITITVEAEEKQQEEVKRYEEERQRIADEKRLAEEQRISDLKALIMGLGMEANTLRLKMTIDNIEETRTAFKTLCERYDLDKFKDVIELLYQQIEMSEANLNIQEGKLIEQEELRKKQEEIKAKEEEQKKERERQHLEQMRIREEEERIHAERIEAAKMKKEAELVQLQSGLITQLAINGFHPEGKLWVKGNNHVSVEFTYNRAGDRILPYETVHELDCAIAQWEEDEKNRIERERKEEEAKNKIAELETQAKLEYVNDEFIFPTDLGIENDIELMANQMKKMAQVMQEDFELTNPTILKTWNAFSDDMNKVFVKYIGALAAQRNLKGQKNGSAS